jgi:hypothetical protein
VSNSLCHPNVKYHSSGLCVNCYTSQWRQNLSSEKKEKYKQKAIIWRNNNSEKIRLNDRIQARKPQNRFEKSRRTAFKRNYLWELTFEQWLVLVDKVNCHYCCGPLEAAGSGLDRKDNTKGYILDNVVPCCKSCNIIKGDRFSYEQMMKLSPALKQIRENSYAQSLSFR